MLVLSSIQPDAARGKKDRLKPDRDFRQSPGTQHQGRPIRAFFAFDPRRCAILLIGGDKTGDKRFYQRMIPVADRLFDKHLNELKDEGLLQ